VFWFQDASRVLWMKGRSSLGRLRYALLVGYNLIRSATSSDSYSSGRATAEVTSQAVSDESPRVTASPNADVGEIVLSSACGRQRSVLSRHDRGVLWNVANQSSSLQPGYPWRNASQ